MGTGIYALLAFIGIIILWNLVLRRNIAEAMLAGLLATALFGGAEAPELMWGGLVFAATNYVLYAAVAFVFMAYAIEHLGIISSLVNILNSLFGRVSGGAAYVDTVASGVTGSLIGSISANTATTGSITAPWLVRSNFSKELSATIIAGNSGLGVALPPNASMFIMLGFAPIAAAVQDGDLYIALLVAGGYQIIYRVFLIMYFVKRYRINTISPALVQPLSETLRTGWTSTLIFFGALIPIAVTVGPLAEHLESHPNIGVDAVESISLITWIPILIILIGFSISRAKMPKTASDWSQFFDRAIPRFSTIGALLLFAFAASQVLADLGLADDLSSLIESMDISKWLMTIIVALAVTLVAGPLSSTATLTAIGLVAFTALVSTGVDPLLAVVAILVFTSTEGASAPGGASIFIAAALTGARAESIFLPLITYYVIPIVLIGWLIAMKILPLPGIA